MDEKLIPLLNQRRIWMSALAPPFHIFEFELIQVHLSRQCLGCSAKFWILNFLSVVKILFAWTP